MPRKKLHTRTRAQNIQIANQRHAERNQNDIECEPVQSYKKTSWQFQFNQFRKAGKALQKELLTLPTQSLSWSLSWLISVHILTSHPILGSFTMTRMTVILMNLITVPPTSPPSSIWKKNSESSLKHSKQQAPLYWRKKTKKHEGNIQNDQSKLISVTDKSVSIWRRRGFFRCTILWNSTK